MLKLNWLAIFRRTIHSFKYQFGFRGNRSINDAIFLLTDNVLRARNNLFYSCVGYLDLSKAFNCIRHSLLLDKLKHYGVKGKCFRWFESYLSDRLQFTTIGNNVSSKVKVPNRVPQGSVLGPILYLIYVNDIEHCGVESRVLMFTDDTVLISSHPDPEIVSSKLSKDLGDLSGYFGKLSLKLNAKKTKVMNFGKSWRSNLLIHWNFLLYI